MGRPAESRKKVSIRLTDAEMMKLAVIGEGNVLKGLRVVIGEAFDAGRDRMRIEVVHKLVPRGGGYNPSPSPQDQDF